MGSEEGDEPPMLRASAKRRVIHPQLAIGSQRVPATPGEVPPGTAAERFATEPETCLTSRRSYMGLTGSQSRQRRNRQRQAEWILGLKCIQWERTADLSSELLDVVTRLLVSRSENLAPDIGDGIVGGGGGGGASSSSTPAQGGSGSQQVRGTSMRSSEIGFSEQRTQEADLEVLTAALTNMACGGYAIGDADEAGFKLENGLNRACKAMHHMASRTAEIPAPLAPIAVWYLKDLWAAFNEGSFSHDYTVAALRFQQIKYMESRSDYLLTPLQSRDEVASQQGFRTGDIETMYEKACAGTIPWMLTDLPAPAFDIPPGAPVKLRVYGQEHTITNLLSQLLAEAAGDGVEVVNQAWSTGSRGNGLLPSFTVDGENIETWKHDPNGVDLSAWDAAGYFTVVLVTVRPPPAHWIATAVCDPYSVCASTPQGWKQARSQRHWRKHAHWVLAPVAHRVAGNNGPWKMWPDLMSRSLWFLQELFEGRLVRINGTCRNVVVVRFDDVSGGQVWLKEKLRSMGLNLRQECIATRSVRNAKTRQVGYGEYNTDTIFPRDSAILNLGWKLPAFLNRMQPLQAWVKFLVFSGCASFTPSDDPEAEVGIQWLSHVQALHPDPDYIADPTRASWCTLPPQLDQKLALRIAELLEGAGRKVCHDAYRGLRQVVHV